MGTGQPLEIPNCDSISDDPFNSFHRRGIHILHLNVRSLIPKLEELRNVAKETKAAVIGLSETWLDDSVFNTEIVIDGYSIFRHDRSRNGVGVCAYIKNDLVFRQRLDLMSDNMETVWYFRELVFSLSPLIIQTKTRRNFRLKTCGRTYALMRVAELMP